MTITPVREWVFGFVTRRWTDLQQPAVAVEDKWSAVRSFRRSVGLRVMALASGYSYVILWGLAYSYTVPLGLTPEELGVSHSGLLIRAAVLGFGATTVLAFIAAIFVPFLGVFVIPLLFLDGVAIRDEQASKRDISKNKGGQLLERLIITVACGGAIFFLWQSIVGPLGALSWFGLVVLFLVLFLVVKHSYLVPILSVLLVYGLGGFAYSLNYGLNASACAIQPGSYTELTSVSWITGVPVDENPSVGSLSETQRKSSPNKLLNESRYLGHEDGVFVFTDYSHIIRITQTGEVVLTTKLTIPKSDMECKWEAL